MKDPQLFCCCCFSSSESLSESFLFPTATGTPSWTTGVATPIPSSRSSSPEPRTAWWATPSSCWPEMPAVQRLSRRRRARMSRRRVPIQRCRGLFFFFFILGGDDVTKILNSWERCKRMFETQISLGEWTVTMVGFQTVRIISIKIIFSRCSGGGRSKWWIPVSFFDKTIYSYHTALCARGLISLLCH